jgi:hypothetical protein
MHDILIAEVTPVGKPQAALSQASAYAASRKLGPN